MTLRGRVYPEHEFEVYGCTHVHAARTWFTFFMSTWGGPGFTLFVKNPENFTVV